MSTPNTTLPFWKKGIYGSGVFGLAAFGMLRQLFYAIFLTDVVGLDPRLASIGALVGIFWDAVNDPLVGLISDRVKSRWGRRRPFLLIFAVPFALSYLILWWAPPWQNQWALAAYVTFVFMLSDTVGTLVSVPYSAMTPEITPDYDQRTSLTSYRMFFQLFATLLIAVAAPAIVDASVKAGLSQQQGYLIVSSLFGGISIIPLALIFFSFQQGTQEKYEVQSIPLKNAVSSAWKNIPFRIAVMLNMFNWLAADCVALIIPYFLLYWIAGGDLLATANVFGLHLSLDSAVLGLLALAAILAIPFWNHLAIRMGKRNTYLVGILPWILAYVALFLVQPGQINWMMAIAILAGFGLSAGYVLPEAIFPDVIEWNELLNRHRQEGIYYGIKNFIRKISGALAFFLSLQVLGWSGYIAPPSGSISFQQPAHVLLAIRVLAGPVGVILLIGAAISAWYYPLSKERHDRIRRLISRRKSRQVE